MAETPKKRTPAKKTTTKATEITAATAAKPLKTAAKKANGAAEPVAVKSNVIQIGHEQVAVLAHTYWQQRGFKHGHHEEDWFRAEQELRGKAS
jgi:hypothetical protein